MAAALAAGAASERCVVVEMSDMQHDRMAFEALHAQLDTLQHAPVDHADLRSGLRSSGAVRKCSSI